MYFKLNCNFLRRESSTLENVHFHFSKSWSFQDHCKTAITQPFKRWWLLISQVSSSFPFCCLTVVSEKNKFSKLRNPFLPNPVNYNCDLIESYIYWRRSDCEGIWYFRLVTIMGLVSFHFVAGKGVDVERPDTDTTSLHSAISFQIRSTRVVSSPWPVSQTPLLVLENFDVLKVNEGLISEDLNISSQKIVLQL